jgi:hypothetical protein
MSAAPESATSPRYVKQDGFIHVAHARVDINLCGLPMKDDGIEVEPQKITCPGCAFIIRYVKAIPDEHGAPKYRLTNIHPCVYYVSRRRSHEGGAGL